MTPRCKIYCPINAYSVVVVVLPFMGTINNSSDEPDRATERARESRSRSAAIYMLVGIEIVDRASHQMARKYRFPPLKSTLPERDFSALSLSAN